MKISVQDLKRHYDILAEPLQAAARRVLDSGWYVLGREVRAFEEEFAAYLGAKECVTVGNGTDALELALRALSVGPGDEVCTVANAGMYSTTAILNAGATPVFVDVLPDSLTISPENLAAKLTSRTKAVIVTHLYGFMVEMESLLTLARDHGLPLIEDCAQAHGAKRHGKSAGTLGDIGCFSFYPTKNLGALGDGGGLCVNDPALAERLRALRQYGWTSRYHSTEPGGRNSRLDEIQAAFLRVKLPQLDKWNARRRAIGQAYNAAFRDCGLLLPDVKDESHVVHLYVVRLPQRDKFRELLSAAGVSSDIHYPVTDYAQESVCKHLGGVHPLPDTELACGQVLTLPCFPEMTDAEVDHVINAVHSASKQLSK